MTCEARFSTALLTGPLRLSLKSKKNHKFWRWNRTDFTRPSCESSPCCCNRVSNFSCNTFWWFWCLSPLPSNNHQENPPQKKKRGTFGTSAAFSAHLGESRGFLFNTFLCLCAPWQQWQPCLVPCSSQTTDRKAHFFMNFHHVFIPFPVAFPETGRPDEALTKFLPAMVTLQKGLVGHGPAWHKSLTWGHLQDEAEISCLICTASPTSESNTRRPQEKKTKTSLVYEHGGHPARRVVEWSLTWSYQTQSTPTVPRS